MVLGIIIPKKRGPLPIGFYFVSMLTMLAAWGHGTIVPPRYVSQWATSDLYGDTSCQTDNFY